ncbi:DUF2759 domain-containing protein [Bacillaceae bacterium S4-13-58]
MVLAILFLFVTILCVIATLREVKRKNILALGFAGISALVFGWFTVMTMYSELFTSAAH